MNGKPVTEESLSDAIQAGNGEPVALMVARDGETVTLRATRPEKIGGRYTARLHARGAVQDYGPLEAIGQAIGETWRVTARTGAALGRIVSGSDRDEVSSPVGIVQGSSQALQYDYRVLPGDPRAHQPLPRAPQPAPVPAARRRAHPVLAHRGDSRPRGAAHRLRARVGDRDRARAHALLPRASRTTSTASAADEPHADRARGRCSSSSLPFWPPPPGGSSGRTRIRAAQACGRGRRARRRRSGAPRRGARGSSRKGVAPVLLISDGERQGWTRANKLCDGGAEFQVVCFEPEPGRTQGEAREVARTRARSAAGRTSSSSRPTTTRSAPAGSSGAASAALTSRSSAPGPGGAAEPRADRPRMGRLRPRVPHREGLLAAG